MKRPANHFIVAVLIGSFGFGCCLCRPGRPPEKFAVLASTYMADDGGNVPNNYDFWHDVVLMYCTLIEKDFEAENIFVLYGNGEDFSSDFDAYTAPFCNGTAPEITNISFANSTGAYKANLCNVLCCLSTGHPAKIVGGVCACRTSGEEGVGGFTCSSEDYDIPRLGKMDFLFTWVKGHGRTRLDGTTKLSFESGADITDQTFAKLFKKLRPERRVLFVETCESGGWLDNYQDDMATVVVTSSYKNGQGDREYEDSWWFTYDEINPTTGGIDLIDHSRFSYWINAALREQDQLGDPVPSEADGNNLVSIEEGFKTAKIKVEGENLVEGYGGPMHPAMSTPEGLAPCIFIALPVPGRDNEVFSMDHDGDDGTVPSVGALKSPDVWLSDPVNGSVIQGSANAGTEYNVHARVYNIGCSDPGRVKVNFFAPVLADCDDKTKWALSSIGYGIIEDLPIGESRDALAKWIPAQGEYCLIAELSARNDDPKDANVASDNNKAQIEVVSAN